MKDSPQIAEPVASLGTGKNAHAESTAPARDRAFYDKQLEELLTRIQEYSPTADVRLLHDAYEFSFHSHEGQSRRSGLPYFDHIMEVAKILVEQKMDVVTLAAAFLHDVIEDTSVKLESLRARFGDEIAYLVDGVTKIGGINIGSLEIRQAENYRKMLLSLVKDARVIIIKFADRLHNMRTIDALPVKKRERIAMETRDVYAPLAHRFGMARIRWELEDLVLKVLDSAAYWELSSLVNAKREEREQYVAEVANPLEEKMTQSGVRSQIHGRAKHFFSIYNKMKKRNKPFQEIYDLLAIRIVVPDVVDCYKALGIVHGTYTPVTERFKDYIAVPKLNGYQSIHTTVIGPDGRMVEIQIRTQEMHQIAEEGIAAHWLYKEGKLQMGQLDRQIGWVRQLIDRQKDFNDPGEFLEDLKIDLFQDEVFVFTPRGDLIPLPKAATPIDFAFAVHSEVGLHCIGAKVNGRIVPLHSELKSGDLVEIITSEQQTPSTHWLEIVKTSKARNHIKRHFRNVEFEQSVSLGKELLNNELQALYGRGWTAELLDTLRKITADLRLETTDMLLSSIGRGITSAKSVAGKFGLPRKSGTADQSFFKRWIGRSRPEAAIVISGVENMMIHFAKCCLPIPGDPILGYVTRGRGIHIHKSDCTNVQEALKKEPERSIQARWDVDDQQTFTVQIKIVAYDRKNFLSEVSQRISSTNTNIVSADIRTAANESISHFVVQVRNIAHLNLILDRIRSIQGVISAGRVDYVSPVRN